MASETRGHEKCPPGISTDHLQNRLPISDEDAPSRQVINDVSPLQEAQKTLQEQLESVGLVSEEDKVLKMVPLILTVAPTQMLTHHSR